MDQKIAVIGDEDTVLGFRLAGIQDACVVSESTLSEQVENTKNAAMLIVTEPVAEMIDRQNLRETVKGTIVQIPDKNGSKGIAKQKLGELFESAIGVKLRK